MNGDCGDLKENGCVLESFEKNVYFYGKLISARDMTLEQRTNERKLYTINRLVLGSGLVCGLKTEVTVEKSNLKVSIQPGMAIDGYGRLIVVSSLKNVDATGYEDNKTGTFPTDSSGPVYLYLKYHDCSREPVPISDKNEACQESCCYNRIHEVFNIFWSLTAPTASDQKENLQLKDDSDFAQQYYDKILMGECAKVSDLVLLGVFKKGNNGKWDQDNDETYAKRSIVYDNVMLYEILKEEIKVLNEKINHLSTGQTTVPDVVGTLKAPDVVNWTEDAARNELMNPKYGIKKVDTVYNKVSSSSSDLDKVMETVPKAGDPLGDTVTIKVGGLEVPDYAIDPSKPDPTNGKCTWGLLQYTIKEEKLFDFNDNDTIYESIDIDDFNDYVAYTEPSAGTVVKKGAILKFHVYKYNG